MRKIIITLAILLTAISGQAQDCGPFIELLGKGISEKKEASISIDEIGEVKSVTAEVIYKSLQAPSKVKLWSSEEEFFVDPVDVPISGVQGEGVITSVFRATFQEAAEEFHMDILENSPEFYSMALYVHRMDGTMVSIQEGKLYHVFQNEDNPLVMNIPVPVSDHARDITLRFGISELNEDERWAIFEFEAGDKQESLKIWEFDTENEESDSYTIQEVSFESVPADVDNIKMTLMSENYEGDTRTGDSYIAGIVLLDIPCEYEESEGYCTYTQGYYGNAGGKTCKGESTSELLSRLLEKDLVMGNEQASFTIAAGHVECILDILPGGGPSKVLSEVATCEDMKDIEVNKKGRIKNTLLAQGITLALNLRNSPNLLDFPVNGETFTVRQTEECTDEEAVGIPGTEQEYRFGEEIVDFLEAEATIDDLLKLVNDALAGEDISPLHLSHVADAANLVNEAFDECVVLVNMIDSDPTDDEIGEGIGEGTEESSGEQEEKENEDGTKGVTGISDVNSGNSLYPYPNPVNDRFFIDLSQDMGEVRSAQLYTISGKPVRDILQNLTSSHGNKAEIDVSELPAGFYIIRIESESGSYSGRFGIR